MCESRIQIKGVLTTQRSQHSCALLFVCVFDVQDPECDVQGLIENREYEFRVAACNDSGLSEYLQGENPVTARLPFGESLRKPRHRQASIR